jgi:hypothetical protein
VDYRNINELTADFVEGLPAAFVTWHLKVVGLTPLPLVVKVALRLGNSSTMNSEPSLVRKV